ncbi:hypothetical protein F4825DRAFT_466260 [Nemania diffusa]|nr:hypothetical protein F4825DRAFT_466260 [Nemania diffusa]
MSKAEDTKFNFPLFDMGPEEAAFHVSYDGIYLQGYNQANSPMIYQESGMSYQAELLVVSHGTITPGGDHAVLLVVDFHFATLLSEGRRFKQVDVTMGFLPKDESLNYGRGNHEHAPWVAQMAPEGRFSMDDAQEDSETVVGGNPTISADSSLAAIGIGGQYQQTTADDNTNCAILDSQRWIHNRSSGYLNAAKWRLVENKTSKNGVPPHLRAAILVQIPKRCGSFIAGITVNAKVHTPHANGRSVTSSDFITPVYFDLKDGKWVNFGPYLADVSSDNLTKSLPPAKVRDQHAAA